MVTPGRRSVATWSIVVAAVAKKTSTSNYCECTFYTQQVCSIESRISVYM